MKPIRLMDQQTYDDAGYIEARGLFVGLFNATWIVAVIVALAAKIAGKW